MSGETFTTTMPNGENFELLADRACKYILHFGTTGMKVEFTMLAGQTFKVIGMAFPVTVEMTDIEPALPGGGLQLVPSSTSQ